MAIFRFSLSTVSRSKNRSAVAAAAYRSGEPLFDERQNRKADYSKKNGILKTAIFGWAGTRSELWNGAEGAEKRSNSVTAREIQICLPPELSEKQRWELAEKLAAHIVTRYGVAADLAMHAPSKRKSTNHHAHILFTTREIKGANFGNKTRVLDERKTGSAEIENLRQFWAALCNEALSGKGATIDHRSYKRQGKNRESENLDRPLVELERRGTITEKAETRKRNRRKNRATAALEATRKHTPARRFTAAEVAEIEQLEEQKQRAEKIKKLLETPTTPQSEIDTVSPIPAKQKTKNPFL